MKKDLENIDELFRSKLNENLPDDSPMPNEPRMWERIDQKLEQKNQKRRRIFWWQASFAAAACLLLFLFSKEQFRETPNEKKLQVISNQNPVEPKTISVKIEPEKVIGNTSKKIIEQPQQLEQPKEVFEIQVVDKKEVKQLIIDKEATTSFAYETPFETEISVTKEPRKFRVVHANELRQQNNQKVEFPKSFIVKFNPPNIIDKAIDNHSFSFVIPKKQQSTFFPTINN